MSKVYLTRITNGRFGTTGETCLISDGMMLKFNISGKFLSESPVTFNLGTLQEVEVISLLESNGEVEIAYKINEQFTKKRLEMDLVSAIQTLNRVSGLVFVGVRNDKIEDIRYNQYIYVFLKGRVNTSIVS